jgi:hypothetical protein
MLLKHKFLSFCVIHFEFSEVPVVSQLQVSLNNCTEYHLEYRVLLFPLCFIKFAGTEHMVKLLYQNNWFFQ